MHQVSFHSECLPDKGVRLDVTEVFLAVAATRVFLYKAVTHVRNSGFLAIRRL